MRQRTKAEIERCPHSEPLEEITGSWEYGRRGEMGYRLMGCRLCGGIGKQFFMHINRGVSRPVAEMQRLNREDARDVQQAITAWRKELPEPQSLGAVPAGPDAPAHTAGDHSP
jgi:hypothetical protein